MSESLSIIRKPQLLDRLGFSKSTLYKMISKGEFPPPVHISTRVSGWPSSEIDDWIKQRVAESRAA